MNKEQALQVVKTWINLDATLTGEAVNLNRVTFLLSEMSYRRMHVGTSWHWCVPSHVKADGTVMRDIHELATEIVESHYSATEIVKLVTA